MVNQQIDNALTPDIPRVTTRDQVSLYISGNMYEHQLVAWEYSCSLDKCALLMEQGTGKTLVAIAAIGYRYARKEVGKVLIVAPLSVIPFWKKELRRFAKFPFTIADLTKLDEKERTAKLEKLRSMKGVHIVLINYESTWRYYPGLKAWMADMIICDESQKIKRYKAKQARAMHYLGGYAKYKMILTGTPVTQSPLDFWSQYRFLKPTIFGENFFKFRFKYAIMGGWQHKQVVGYRQLEDLAKRAHSIAYRVTKAEALTLPPQVDEELYVELSLPAQSIYGKLSDEMAVMLESGNTVTVPIVLTQLLRLQQVTGGFVKNDKGEIEQVDNAKLRELSEFFEDFDPQRKVVIFCRFIAELMAIQEVAKAHGRGVITMYGDTVNRGEAVSQFQENPTKTVFVAQIQTGSLGITLTAADTVIFYSTTFGYADYEQAKARVHRVGQQAASVTYIHLLVKESIDEDILAALREKRDVAEYIVDKLKRRAVAGKGLYSTTPIAI